jgi:hypothetical protein
MVHRMVMAILGESGKALRITRVFASCPLPSGRDLLAVSFSLFCLGLVLFVGGFVG